jgi:FMN phosphatase YigB (HAD superfamily)
MKFIFDFDDVLFHNTKLFKEHMYACLERAGVSRSKAEEYYKTVRENQLTGIWLKKLLIHFSLKSDLYEEILGKSKDFINKELLLIIKKIGKENCYIVTHGYDEWQREKIKRVSIEPFFSEIIVVQGGKKEVIEKICAKHKDEEVIFVDDKIKHFENLDFKKCSNLKTILFDENGLEKLKAILPSN